MIVYTSPQGSPTWLEERRAVITGSRFKDCRDRTSKDELSAKARCYAMDVARERCGGSAPSVFVNAAMRFGSEQEAVARARYEAERGEIVYSAGFICTDDRKFGCSVDGLVADDGLIEVKTVVSSETLFRAVVAGDVTEYVDQVNGALWLLHRKWCDLILWAPDLPRRQLTVVRIERDENVIEALGTDLVKFERIVCQYEANLRLAMREEEAVVA